MLRTMTEWEIPSDVTGVGPYAFQLCAALTELTIPSSVTSIGNVAFYKTPLRDIYYGGTEEQWDAIQIGEYNRELRNAAVHYNSRMEDRGVMARGGGTGETVNWVYDRGVRVLAVSGSLSRGGTVYAARYDKNGRLLGVAEAGSDQTFDLSACREARLFWLEDGRPLCQAARISA